MIATPVSAVTIYEAQDEEQAVLAALHVKNKNKATKIEQREMERRAAVRLPHFSFQDHPIDQPPYVEAKSQPRKVFQ